MPTVVLEKYSFRVLRREPSGDMIVDEDGRAFVDNFGFDLMSGASVHTASLVRIDPDGTTTVAATDLSFPDGAAFINGELVVAETLGNRISAFPIDFDGSLGGRRDRARFGDHPTSTQVPEVLGSLAVAPDGMCADAEGAVWAADALGNRAVRVRPQGAVVETVDVGTGVYACALGGEDGRTLFLCTAPGFAEHERRDTREAALLSVRVEIPAV